MMEMFIVNRYVRLVVFSLLFNVFVCCVGFAKVNEPVIIERYDEASLKRINKSFESLRTHIGRLEEVKEALKKLIEVNAANPTEGNKAKVREKTGEAIYFSVEFANSAEGALDKAIPEMEKYRGYLDKISERLKSRRDSALLSAQANWANNENEKLDKFLVRLDQIKKNLRGIKQELTEYANAWVVSNQVKDELRKISGGGKLGKVFSGMAKGVKCILELRNLLIAQLRENGLSDPSEEYDEKWEEYESVMAGWQGG